MKNKALLVASLGLVASAMVVQAIDRGESPKAKPKAAAASIAKLVGTSPTGEKVNVLGPGITVVAMSTTTCPISKKLAPELERITAAYKSKGVRFVFVNPYESEPKEDVVAASKKLGNYIWDKDDSISRKLGAKTTTEVFVYGPDEQLIYRGAVNDQYAVGASKPSAKNDYLRGALDAALAGKAPKIKTTAAPGCALALAPDPVAKITYYGKVAGILNKNCVSCHYPGGTTPFRLDRLEDARDRAPMIKYAVENRIMPPWFAAKETPSHGGWRNDRSLSSDEIAALVAWADNGTPAGDAKSAPAKPAFPTGGWEAGKPDQIFRIPQPITIKAEGTMAYQNVRVDVNLPEDKWVQGVEIRPTARQVVHHVLIFAVPHGERRKVVGESDGFLAGYVPGNTWTTYDPGFAKRLPKGHDLIFQIHYTPNGTETKDQCELGLRYVKTAPKYEIRTFGLENFNIQIPPNDPNYKSVATFIVPVDAKIISFMPHMHVRGKAAKYELIDAEGKSQVLLDVPRYDFNWQLSYVPKKEINVTKGSKLRYTAWYDNSKNNPANPNPNATVFFGPQTFDEMMLGYLDYYVPTEGIAGNGMNRPRGIGNVDIETIFRQLDKNKDGKITRDEFPMQKMFDRLDENHDGVITLDEARKFGG
jgi:thiol-disulfide isomerase/thioredoxin